MPVQAVRSLVSRPGGRERRRRPIDPPHPVEPGQPLPLASNLNCVAGEKVPNLVVAKVGAGGKVTVYNSVESTHVVLDVGRVVAG